MLPIWLGRTYDPRIGSPPISTRRLQQLITTMVMEIDVIFHLILCSLSLLFLLSVNSQIVEAAPLDIIHNGGHHGKFISSGTWHSAHATFYGGTDGSETTEGSCGYQDTVKQGYGLQTAAVSTALYNEGRACGACFEIKCANDLQWCKPGQPPILVTATNVCPPNYALSSDNGGWCNPPRVHFDLTMPAFLQIAEYKAGIVPIKYRRVACKKQGGIRFTMKGNRYFNLVLVWNVAGAGDVRSVKVLRGNRLPWISMKRNWGQNWQTDKDLSGQSLTFRVMTSDKRKSTSWHVAPPSWQFGSTYEGKNFKF